ncbi:MAG: TldD/PmbA family protein [Candidatus Heimdallarchaeota archaeon]|nr:TldD/PmbA family protein [Candidatus Heimdallarchaeota archaeon]
MLERIIEVEEYGNPGDLIQDKLDWLLNAARNRGFDALVRGDFTVEGVTRYAVSQVTQHSELSNISLFITLSRDKKLASVNTTRLDDKGVQDLLDQAINACNATPDIPFYQGLPSPRSRSAVNLKGYNWTIEERAESVITAVNAAEEIDPTVILAGTAEEKKSYSHILSTEGIDVEDGYSQNRFKVNAILGEPEYRGYGQEGRFWRYDQPDYAVLAKEAATTARDTINLKTLDAGNYEVVLGSQALSDIFLYAQFTLDAVSFNEGNSFASDRLGDQIFDEKLTVHDLPRDPKSVNMVYNYDAEGIASENRVLFDKGALKFIPYNSFSASKYLDDKNASTGHNVGMWTMGIPLAISIEKGDRSLDKQLSEIKDGLYVKNFWYNRLTIRREGGLTGLTRNGLFHVKDGEIQGAVRNLRYTESFVRALSPGNVLSLSNTVDQYEINSVPSVHLNTYRFSSVAHTDPTVYKK